jgi:hypothetical protein
VINNPYCGAFRQDNIAPIDSEGFTTSALASDILAPSWRAKQTRRSRNEEIESIYQFASGSKRPE